jgi:hypothetical protein
MFADIEADVYVMADGDATYDTGIAPKLVERLLEENLDMVVARRVHVDATAYRRGHAIGNRLFSSLLAHLFGARFADVFSGYRALSRRFVKSFPALSQGFETETEVTVHALTLSMPTAEIDAKYCSRPNGSTSKLRTLRDGLRILRVTLALFKSERPLAFFAGIAAILALLSLGLSMPIFITYFETGLVPRFPTAILSASIMVLASLCTVSGIVLDTVTRGRRELKRIAYLAMPAPQEALTIREPVINASRWDGGE